MSTYTSDPGTRLGGRYRLEDRLAATGGWSAWKAIDEILARPVSVITFAAGFPRLEQVVTAARAASRLTDTRLTQVFDVEDSWDRGYIVLEWPVGDTLADLLADDSMEPQAAARIVAEAAAALAVAHAAGLAHLCLRPDAIRWTAGGGVKVTGLGIDAALSGVIADDPELADTRGLGQLLYAALTGLWPGADSPELPPAPQPDGQLPPPSQLRSGVAPALDEVVARALALPDRDTAAVYQSPAELAAALSAAIPPLHLPPAAIHRGTTVRQRRGRSDSWPSSPWPPEVTVTDGYSRSSSAARSPSSMPGGRRSPARLAAIGVLVLVAIAGASAAAVHLLNKPPSPPTAGNGTSPKPTSTSQTAVIRPVSAQGFDALNPNGDAGDENSSQAVNVLNGNAAGWSTQEYYGNAEFGGLKAGTGFILDLGRSAQLRSVTVTFGSVPGANVQLKLGDSGERSPANLAAMKTVASASDLSGSYTFTIRQHVSGRYLVIWFTKLPPESGSPGKFVAQIFSVAVRGTT